jgi:hypothetical protein
MMDKGYASGNYTTKFVEEFLKRTPIESLNFENY